MSKARDADQRRTYASGLGLLRQLCCQRRRHSACVHKCAPRLLACLHEFSKHVPERCIVKDTCDDHMARTRQLCRHTSVMRQAHWHPVASHAAGTRCSGCRPAMLLKRCAPCSTRPSHLSGVLFHTARGGWKGGSPCCSLLCRLAAMAAHHPQITGEPSKQKTAWVRVRGLTLAHST